MFTQVGATTFFAASDDTHGLELWKTDGTAAGTSLVRDFNPGPTNGFFADLYRGMVVTLNGNVLAIANDGIHGYELWRTDGTVPGTFLLADTLPGAGSGLE